MKEYKNIDHVFQESASGFKPEPSEKVWSGIINEFEPEVAGNKFISYRRIAALVLLLVLSGTAVWYFKLKTDSNSTDIFNRNEEIINNEKIIINKDENLNDDIVQDKLTITNDVIAKNENLTDNSQIEIIKESNNELPNVESNKNIIVSDIKEDESDDNIRLSKIDFIKPSSIYSLVKLDYELLEQKIDVQEYMNRRRKLHTYSALSAKAAIMYYPNTTDQFTYAVDAEFGVVMKNFYIQSGIGYQKVKERGLYNFHYKTNDSIGFYNKVVSFEINPLNPDEITYKTTKTTVYDSLEHINTQSPLFYYSYINLPIKFGYKLKQFKHFSIAMETGIIFSKLVESKIPEASFYMPESTLIKIDDNTPVRRDFNYQVVVGLKFNYKLFKSVSISAEPEFTKYLNSIYKSSPDISSTKPYSMGLRFGIYYDF